MRRYAKSVFLYSAQIYIGYLNLCYNFNLYQNVTRKSTHRDTATRRRAYEIASINLIELSKIGHIRKEAGHLNGTFK